MSGPKTGEQRPEPEFPLVGDPELVAEINDDSKFAKHVSSGFDALRPILGDGLITARDTEANWQLAHDVLMPAFTAAAMRSYHPVMLGVTRELVESWDGRAGEWIDVTGDMTKLTIETIGRAGFGYRFGTFERDEPHPFLSAMTRVLYHALLQAAPSAQRAAQPSADQYRQDLELIAGLVDKVIDERWSTDSQDDLLGRMLNSAHPETGERLDRVNVRHQVLTFLVAGHETTSGALSFALYYLARHPDVLAAARAEVADLWGPDPGFEPEYRGVAKLRYLRQVFNESIRLWPPTPVYAREARHDLILGGRHHLRRGDWVVVLLRALHRAPSIWGPDPERFDPDRFTPEAIGRRPGHGYRPFGTGMRACIGRQFALHEALLALGRIVHRYDLIPEPGYRLRTAGEWSARPDGFRLQLTKRTDAR